MTDLWQFCFASVASRAPLRARALLARAAAFAANLLAERKPALQSAGRLADRAIRQSLLGY